MPLPQFIAEYVEADSNRRQRKLDVPPNGIPVFDAQGRLLIEGARFSFTNFQRGLPVRDALTAGTTLGFEDCLVYIDAGTAVPAIATDGGISLVTGTSDNDTCILIPGNTIGFLAKLTAASRPRLRTVVNLPSIANVLAYAGLNETVTSVDPSQGATDGAGFLFDPALQITTTNTASGGTAVTDANKESNIILQQKVAGTDTYQDSGIPVIAGVDYELRVDYDANLKPHYYINGEEVGVAGIAGTSAVTLQSLIGVQCTEASAAKTLDVRHVAFSARVG